MENAIAQSTSEDLDVQIKEDIKKEMLQSPAQTLDDGLLSVSESMRPVNTKKIGQPYQVLTLNKDMLVKQRRYWSSDKEAPTKPFHRMLSEEAPVEQTQHLRGEHLRGLCKEEMENAKTQSSSTKGGTTQNGQASHELRVPLHELSQGQNVSLR